MCHLRLFTFIALDFWLHRLHTLNDLNSILNKYVCKNVKTPSLAHSGIVTRCPLELKLRKMNIGTQWTAVISYKEVRETFHDPKLVEGFVRKGQDSLSTNTCQTFKLHQ